VRGRGSDGSSEGLEGSFERTVAKDFGEDFAVKDGGDAESDGCRGGGCVVGGGGIAGVGR